MRHALGHRVRREVLRVLNETEGPRAPREIALATAGRFTVSQIGYHLLVLEEVEAVQRLNYSVELRPARDDEDRRGKLDGLFVSAVADDAHIALVLAATASEDGADA